MYPKNCHVGNILHKVSLIQNYSSQVKILPEFRILLELSCATAENPHLKNAFLSLEMQFLIWLSALLFFKTVAFFSTISFVYYLLLT